MNKKVLQRIPSSLTEEEVKTIINDEIDLENADLNTWTKEDFVTFGNQAEDTISERVTKRLRDQASLSLSHIEKYFRPLSDANETDNEIPITPMI